MYVSLNGIKNTKEIEQSFYAQMHPILSSKGAKYASKLIKGILKSAVKIDMDGDGSKNTSDATFSLPEINFSNYEKIENRILVFDDLERCQMDIKSILGYINEFVEHSGFKVIILADEHKILVEEQKDDLKKYSSIKEKTIGKTFAIISEVNEALDVFMKLISPDAAKILHNNRDAILEIYDTAEYYNLRHLRHAILNFDLFYQFLPCKRIGKSDFIEIVVKHFFALSFELSAGLIKANDINVLFVSGGFFSLMQYDNSEMTPIQKVYRKYDTLKHQRHPINGHLWSEFFSTGSVCAKDLNDCIENSFFFLDEKKPDWVKLVNYRNLNEDEFKEFSSSVINLFESGQITEKFELMQITGILCELSKAKLIENEIGAIIQSATTQLKALNQTAEVVSNPHFPGNHSHGLSFSGSNSEEFRDFLKFARQQEVLLMESEMIPKAVNLLRLMKTDFEQFQKELNNRDDSNQLFQLPILKEIDIAEIMKWVKLTGINNLVKLSEVLVLRYDSSEGVKSKLIPELNWLESLQDEILNYQSISENFTKFRIKMDVLPNIYDSVRLLKEVSSM